ncbi:hypothetical protein EDB92DRAFT_2064107 [Lactarius akahatsu]|uniref:Uncharacterized protein n=1 Tax=Lactarius akahatsu TaxID=416441 RepID=A0AAD4LPF5_9AGAM|nr:hypothetical protein EDB92DRAFT_2064107 [Lactarius akahatsu]
MDLHIYHEFPPHTSPYPPQLTPVALRRRPKSWSILSSPILLMHTASCLGVSTIKLCLERGTSYSSCCSCTFPARSSIVFSLRLLTSALSVTGYVTFCFLLAVHS